MDFFEVIEKRSSVRAYEPVDIPAADLMKILDAGRRAPSGTNSQPLQFILIQDKQTLKALEGVQSCFATASAAIGIVADPAASRWWHEDCSAATENMLLAIQALGYASVWVEGMLLKAEAFVKELLGVPDELKFPVLLPIGKAAGETSQAPKRPLSETLWREKYGQR